MRRIHAGAPIFPRLETCLPTCLTAFSSDPGKGPNRVKLKFVGLLYSIRLKVIQILTLKLIGSRKAFCVILTCISGCNVVGLSSPAYADAQLTRLDHIYHEEVDENDPLLTGFDLRLTQIGSQTCYPITSPVPPRNMALQKVHDFLYIEDIYKYEATRCKTSQILYNEFFSIQKNTNLAEYVGRFGGDCTIKKYKQICTHFIMLVRTRRDFYTGSIITGSVFGPVYGLIFGFELDIDTKMEKYSPDRIHVRWFQSGIPDLKSITEQH